MELFSLCLADFIIHCWVSSAYVFEALGKYRSPTEFKFPTDPSPQLPRSVPKTDDVEIGLCCVSGLRPPQVY